MLYGSVTEHPFQQVGSLSRSLFASAALAENQTSKGECSHQNCYVFTSNIQQSNNASKVFHHRSEGKKTYLSLYFVAKVTFVQPTALPSTHHCASCRLAVAS